MRKRPYKLITESSKIEISGSLIEHCAADIEVQGSLAHGNHSWTLDEVCYFEVHLLNCAEGKVSIGLTSEDYPIMHPGYYPISYAYHTDTGSIFSNSDEKEWGPSANTGDVVGCGFLPRINAIFFTKNANLLGAPFTVDPATEVLYPSIGL